MVDGANILIVEDEPSLAQVLVEYLQAGGYRAHWLARGDEVQAWLDQHSADLVVLDLMLPGKDGLSVYRELRTRFDIPVVMATARVDEIDRLIGLELGADDYICKPYSPRELVARIKNILRRSAASNSKSESGLNLDPETLKASVEGQSLDLTPFEFRLLHLLSERPGRIFSRQQLLDHLYDSNRSVSERTVDSHVKNLRRKIDDLGLERGLIHSVYGMGYKFERG
ncbi:MAG: response regulator [Granulosicoccaceae bacterium]